MGVAIKYRPVRNGTYVTGGSDLWQTLQEAFGTAPFELSAANTQTLLGLRAALRGEDRKAIEKLVDAIARHELIEVFGEY